MENTNHPIRNIALIFAACDIDTSWTFAVVKDVFVEYTKENSKHSFAVCILTVVTTATG